MKVIVLGSGVIGLTSAWYLSQAGCSVTVIDRQNSAAKETSFANAGQISYGYSSPWAAPGVPLKAMKWLFSTHAPLKVSPKLSLDMVNWCGKMLSNCRLDRYQVNKSRMLTIAARSQQCLDLLNEKYQLQYQGRKKGTLQIFRKPEQLREIEKDIAVLEANNTPFSLLDRSACLAKEPGLEQMKGQLVGGLHLPDDQTGDCFLFCQQLQKLAQAAGVKFLFDTSIPRIHTKKNQVTLVETSKGKFSADQYVVALGSHSKALLKHIKIHTPIYPVKGYSLTLPVIDNQFAPRSTILDETYKVALTRFDNRIRVAGTAELAGFNTKLPGKRLATLNHCVNSLFPRGTDFTQADYWTGLRPMTPDGPPIIGPTPVKNLYLNTGHGTLGWTLACGSADILTEAVVSQGREYIEELSLARYG